MFAMKCCERCFRDSELRAIVRRGTRMGLHKVTFGPAYTYGAKRATAVVFFDGILGPNTTVPMKVESHCEWIDEKII